MMEAGNQDEEEAIVSIVQGVRSMAHHSIGNLLELAKEAALDGRIEDCATIGKFAIHQAKFANDLVQNTLIYQNYPEWARLESLDGYIEEDRISEIFSALFIRSIGIRSTQDWNIEA